MALADGSVVLEAALGERDALILQVRDLRHAAAAEVAVLDGIVGELRFRRVDDDLAVLGLAVGDGDGHGLDAALVAAPAGTRIVLGKHLVLGDGALAGHQALGDRAAVEEDDLVLVVAVVVVPVKHSGRAFGSKAHGAHGDGGAHINLAGCDDAAVVQLGEQHARADAQIRLHLVPAAQRQCVEVVFFNVLVEHDGDLRQRQGIGGRDLGEVGVVLQMLEFGQDDCIVVGLGANLLKNLREIKGFHVDAVFLHGDLVEADGLERGGARADAAEVEALHAVDHAADGGKVAQILLELGAQRMHDMGLEHRERDIVLTEHVRDGELAAVGVAAVGEVHLADLIGIGLHEDGHARVLQGGDGTVFVGENGHGEDHAVILTLVLLEPLGVEQALVARFDAAVAGQLLVHHDVVIARVSHGLDHIVACAVDQLAGHEAAVAEAKGKGHFLFHG